MPTKEELAQVIEADIALYDEAAERGHIAAQANTGAAAALRALLPKLAALDTPKAPSKARSVRKKPRKR